MGKFFFSRGTRSRSGSSGCGARPSAALREHLARGCHDALFVAGGHGREAEPHRLRELDEGRVVALELAALGARRSMFLDRRDEPGIGSLVGIDGESEKLLVPERHGNPPRPASLRRGAGVDPEVFPGAARDQWLARNSRASCFSRGMSDFSITILACALASSIFPALRSSLNFLNSGVPPSSMSFGSLKRNGLSAGGGLGGAGGCFGGSRGGSFGSGFVG